MSEKQRQHTVVWSGRDELLPDRPETWDSRFSSMPSLDPDDVEEVRQTRKYTYSGRYKRTKQTSVEETNGNDTTNE